MMNHHRSRPERGGDDMDHLPGHNRREERRARRHGRRLVRSGDPFTSEELDEDTIELELPDPTPEPSEDQQAEPWGAAENDPRFAERLRAYKDFLGRTGGYE